MGKKKIVILAGYPATGKSYLMELIRKSHLEFSVITPDHLKEALWDRNGFTNSAEKRRLERESWSLYYKFMAQNMESEIPIITDYPFSGKQKNQLEKLLELFQYKAMTIRMVGDIEVLYRRSRKRDLDQSRHLGHLVQSYQKGDYLADRSMADDFLQFDLFQKRCLMNGYDKFQLGELIEIDATYLEKVQYDVVLKRVNDFLR